MVMELEVLVDDGVKKGESFMFYIIQETYFQPKYWIDLECRNMNREHRTIFPEIADPGDARNLLFTRS